VHLQSGEVFAGDFRIERPLARGGMGAVYVAEQLSTGRRRALKLMPTLAAGRLVTRQFPLERIEEGFAHAAAGHGVKTVITPGAV